MAPIKGSKTAPASASEKLCKAAKDDEVKRCQEALDKGADVNFKNEKGHTAAHVAAAFGALNVLVWLHKNGADFWMENDKELTPREVAQSIGEDDAAELIRALLDGKPDSEIQALLQAGGEDPLDLEPPARDGSYKPKMPSPPSQPQAQSELEVLSPTEPDKKPSRFKVSPAVVAPEDHHKSYMAAEGSALLWADVYGHGRKTEGAATKAGGLTVLSSPGTECWVLGMGADILQPGDAFAYRITHSRFDTADAMLLGVADAEAASALESRGAKSAFYNPRASEVWLMDHSRVLERVPLDPGTFRLLGKAAGAEVTLRLVAGGGLGLKIDGADEVVVAANLPASVKPCARLGKVGDAIALRKCAAKQRSERASNDSVITHVE